MKARTFILAMVVVLAFSVPCFGKVWHVNNNAGVVRDFATPQEAHDSEEVLAGDTLYVYGSPTHYGDLTLTKQLHVMGPGYFLGENLDTQVNPSSGHVGTLTINESSDNSSITGLTFGTIVISTNNISIIRNHIATLLVDANVTGTIIHQNFFVTGGGTDSIRLSSSVANCTITNNIILKGGNHDNHTERSILMNGSSSATIVNNVFNSEGIKIYNSDVTNNILYSGKLEFSNCSIKNNIGNSAQFGTENGNKSNVDMVTVFVGEGSQDGKYQLKNGSLAIGAGLDGEDCGAFGGNSPYVLSGISPIPAIHRFSAPTIGSNMSGLPVKIKVKAHD